MIHWFSCSLNTFDFLRSFLLSFTFSLNLDAKILINSSFYVDFMGATFPLFLVVLDFIVELINEV